LFLAATFNLIDYYRRFMEHNLPGTFPKINLPKDTGLLETRINLKPPEKEVSAVIRSQLKT